MTPSSYTTIRRLGEILLAGALIGLLAACGGGSSSAGAGASGQGALAIRMTDAPLDSVSQVNVRIVGLKIKPSGSPVQTLNFQPRTVDLLTLQNSTQLMIVANVPAGHYDFIQVELDESGSSVVDGGQAKPLKIPSQEIKVLGGFQVNPDSTTNVLLDFDANASLLQTGGGNWQLKPVILQANVTAS